MASIDFGSFFGTSGSNNSTGMGSLLGDYMQIKNGSYGKLMKSYYKMEKEDAKNIKKDGTVTTTDKAIRELKDTKSEANELTGALKKLSDKSADSIYAKVTTKNEDGTETTDYDKDKIMSAVKSFVSNYNDVIDKAYDSDETPILTAAAGMAGLTAKSMESLSAVGLSLDKENHLVLDESYFKDKVDMKKVQNLFGSAGGYGTQIESKASSIKSHAQSALNKLGSYDKSGNHITARDIYAGYNQSI